jgi:hypothetical protein
MDDLQPCPFCMGPATGVNLREVAQFVSEPARTQGRKFGYAAECSSCGARGPFIEVQDPFNNKRGFAQVETAASGWNGRPLRRHQA